MKVQRRRLYRTKISQIITTISDYVDYSMLETRKCGKFLVRLFLWIRLKYETFLQYCFTIKTWVQSNSATDIQANIPESGRKQRKCIPSAFSFWAPLWWKIFLHSIWFGEWMQTYSLVKRNWMYSNSIFIDCQRGCWTGMKYISCS